MTKPLNASMEGRRLEDFEFLLLVLIDWSIVIVDIKIVLVNFDIEINWCIKLIGKKVFLLMILIKISENAIIKNGIRPKIHY